MKFEELINYIYGFIGMSLIIHSAFVYETTFNPEFVFGAMWMLFSVTQVQFYDFKSKK